MLAVASIEVELGHMLKSLLLTKQLLQQRLLFQAARDAGDADAMARAEAQKSKAERAKAALRKLKQQILDSKT